MMTFIRFCACLAHLGRLASDYLLCARSAHPRAARERRRDPERLDELQPVPRSGVQMAFRPVRTKSIDLGSSGGSSFCVAEIGGPIATPMPCLNKRKRHGSTVFNDFSVDATQSEGPQAKTSKSSSESSSANVALSSGPFSSYSFPCRSNRTESLKKDLPPGVGQSGLQRCQLSFQRERGAVEGAVDE
jgi:hypothetical protein